LARQPMIRNVPLTIIDRCRLMISTQIRALALLVLSLTLCAACSTFDSSALRWSPPTLETYKLDNGLTVYLAPSDAVPLVTMDICVRTGAKDEPDHIAGISHFLEHMIFKGTPRLDAGEYDRRIEEMGGYLNAATSNDYTHYYITVPSEHMVSALTDLADVIQNSSIDPEEVERERHVILEEIRMKQDNPIGFMFDEIVRATYASGPYANTVIGSDETVSATTRDQIKEHYERFYAPDNMALSVAGDFDLTELRTTIEELFGSMERKLSPWREDNPETVFAAPAGETWEKSWAETYFFFTFPGEDAKSLREMAAMDVAEAILFSGRSSRLVRTLREQDRLVHSISGIFLAGRYPGLYGIYGTTDTEKLDELKVRLFEELDELRRKGPTKEELARAKRQLVNDHLYQTETVTGKASVLSYSFASLGQPLLLSKYPEAVEKVSEKDVLEVLKAFDQEKVSTYITQPAPLGVQ